MLAVPAMAQICGNALISYYLEIVLRNIGTTNSNDQLKIDIGMTVYALCWSILSALNVDKFKRKTMFMGGYILMCISYVGWTILSAINRQSGFKNKG